MPNTKKEKKTLFHESGKVTDEVVKRYEDATVKYIGHLEEEVKEKLQKELHKFAATEEGLQQIRQVYRDVVEADPDDQNLIQGLNEKQIQKLLCDAILQEYISSPDYAARKKCKELFKNACKDETRLTETLDKLFIIDKARSLLKESKHMMLGSDKAGRVENFYQHLKKHKSTLNKRRDNAFVTFIKACGVALSSIFGVGVGGYFAYRDLFVTKGEKLREETKAIRKTHTTKF